MFCTKCGKEFFGSVCPNCGENNEETKKIEIPQKTVNEKKKDSVLSILSCVFAGVTMIFPTFVGFAYLLLLAAIIIAIVDLAMKDNTKRHIGSWFGLIASIIIFLVLF